MRLIHTAINPSDKKQDKKGDTKETLQRKIAKVHNRIIKYERYWSKLLDDFTV